MPILDLANLPDATLVAHYRADDYTAGDWPDRTANSYDLAQATGADQPTAVADGGADFNNQPVVRLDGSSDFLFRDTTPATTQPFTFVAIAKTTLDNAANKFLIGSRSGAQAGRPRANFDSTEALSINAGSDLNSGSGSLLDSADLLEMHFNGTSSAIRQNSVVLAEGDAGTVDMEGLVVGAITTGSGFWGGDIAEILIVDGELTHADRVYLAQYANQRYGIALPFPQTDDPTTTSVSSPSTIISVNRPAMKAGELFLAFLSMSDQDAAIQNFGSSTELSQIFNEAGAGDDMRSIIFARVMPSDIASGTESFTADVSTQYSAHGYRIGLWGGSIASHVRTVAEGINTGTGPNPPSVTIPWLRAKSLVIAASMAGDDGVVFSGFPSGYSGGTSTTASANSVGSARKEVAAGAGSENPSAFTLDSSEAFSQNTIAIAGITPVSEFAGGIMAGGL